MRDLADGAPIAGEEFEIREAASESRLRATGPNGELLISGDASKVAISHPKYRVVNQPGEARGTDEIWAFAELEVNGTVATDPPGAVRDLARVSIGYALPLDKRGPMPRTTGTQPWTSAWATAHGIRSQDDLGHSKSDGSFRFSVPRIKSLLVVARLPGWRPAWAAVDVSQPSTTTTQLTLRRSNVLRGKLADEDGSPIAGVKVSGYCGINVPFDSVDMATLSLTGHTVTLVGNSDYNTAKVTFVVYAETAPDGSFEIPLNADGEVLLMAWPANRAPASLLLGRVAENRQDLALVAKKGNGKKVRFLAEGQPLARTAIILGDLTSPVGQPTAGPIMLSENGEMSADWLEDGHRYAVMVLGPIADRLSKEKKDVLVWAGQASVEVTTDLATLK